VGAQSHGSVSLLRKGWQTARPPNFFNLAVFGFERRSICKGALASNIKEQSDAMNILS
jgi:hypothetical protein